ncbi:putative vacuolar protein sorting-associated protein 62 [Colletotrichum sublineola]|uniref:Putative vacuolar protein sorting-associated protein 62 n=1 Tax=Colletotrichum sublineola TaxID=1173701 RepID=A0A066XUD1_COLSU|nr:putative vacuolar protein sorting-associated protein 62 [Colletotrichum sublineola]
MLLTDRFWRLAPNSLPLLFSPTQRDHSANDESTIQEGRQMADATSAFMRAVRPRSLLLLVCLLLACCTLILAERDGADRQCPDYVTSHAPLLWLHSDDRYMPSDLLAHIRHTSPVLDGKPVPDLPPLDLDNLEILNEFGDEVALTSDDDPTTYPAWLFGAPPDPDGRVRDATPCVVILVDKNERDVDAFYFYFYSYNEGPNITQVLEPFNHVVGGEKAASGMHFGDHIGDWEHNMIRFRDGKPVGIYFSQHVDGASYSWDDSELSTTDGRPIVYSACGSHANYPTPGSAQPTSPRTTTVVKPDVLFLLLGPLGGRVVSGFRPAAGNGAEVQPQTVPVRADGPPAQTPRPEGPEAGSPAETWVAGVERGHLHVAVPLLSERLEGVGLDRAGCRGPIWGRRRGCRWLQEVQDEEV